ncbi:MAG: hypothetical protein J4N76_10205 [Chloroflexi bacterium]|nr:hypothetical protein [Chloroflexota bacterium]MCI0807132.1 hypothetical protein [Chloroflexota bacterium]MCI0828088.1 hypothetical protein [Chloroflexota bacterium]MCI0854556.1 hypothetical protein [Chloroflexota bacterium]MCI0862252.1 hypothetical protein [Chloroflexota bacterium]
MSGENSSGLKWRIAFSIITSMIWLIFIVAWIGFGWNDFETSENIAVLCISSVVWMGSNSLVWVIWPNRANSEGEAG